jgi:hypothetical protein
MTGSVRRPYVTGRDARIFDIVQGIGGSSAGGRGASGGGWARSEGARKLLYEWRAAWRKLGAAAFNRKRERKPGLARELERKIGKQQMDIDFFREALRLIDALERKTSATSSTRSSKP